MQAGSHLGAFALLCPPPGMPLTPGVMASHLLQASSKCLPVRDSVPLQKGNPSPTHHTLFFYSIYSHWTVLWGFPGGSNGKESACSPGDRGSIPGLGKFPGKENGYPLQYSGPENPMDRENMFYPSVLWPPKPPFNISSMRTGIFISFFSHYISSPWNTSWFHCRYSMNVCQIKE